VKILFIINMGRRQKTPSRNLIEAFHSLFRRAGVEYRIELTHATPEAVALAKEAVVGG
jgi:hypothetical protein